MKYYLTILLICHSTCFIAQSNLADSYQIAYEKLDSMICNKSQLNLKKAIYTTENAYYDGKLNYESFERLLQQYASFSRNLSEHPLITYNYPDYHSVNTHAAIFQMMTDTIPVYVNDSTIATHLPMYYNFDDYAGQQNWENMFVSTLMVTHKGNCHSLPLLYKLIAEELGEKAWLSLAPNHFYIRLHNKANGWYNTELTSGQFPTDAWIKASGYVHLDAIKSGMYMDTLSIAESIAVCMIDLAEGYRHKYPETYHLAFVLKCCNRALDIFPDYINAMLLKAETLLTISQTEKDHKAFEEAEQLYARIHKLGYRKMPEAMYLKWLSSLQQATGMYKWK